MLGEEYKQQVAKKIRNRYILMAIVILVTVTLSILMIERYFYLGIVVALLGSFLATKYSADIEKIHKEKVRKEYEYKLSKIDEIVVEKYNTETSKLLREDNEVFDVLVREEIVRIYFKEDTLYVKNLGKVQTVKLDSKE